MKTYMRAFTGVLTAAVLAGVPFADAAAQAYKYKDEKGEVVFSDRPPPKGETAEVVKLEKSPAVKADKPGAQREEARKYMEEGTKKLKAEQGRRKQAKVDDAARKQACEQARQQLWELTNGPPNRRRVQDADGLTRRVTVGEMDAAIDAARGNVSSACGLK